MYAKCGALRKAKQVLDELPVQDVASWSALIGGYAQQGQVKEALDCFDGMQSKGIPPNAVTFICALKACSSIEAIGKGKEIHDQVVGLGLLGKDVALGNALVNMYAKCGMLGNAQEVLDDLPIRDAVTWCALITAYGQQEQGEEALKCFDRMRQEGLSPDPTTFACILKACGGIRALEKGKQIHDAILNQGLLQKDVVLGTALVDMYIKCGVLAKAEEVLYVLPMRNAVSWSAIISGYAQQGQGKKALQCLAQMKREGLSPDAVTYICLLKACGSVGAADEGKRIHDEIVGQGLFGKYTVLGNVLVDMYVKCGRLTKAQEVLRQLPCRDVVSWSALIAGYAQQEQAEEALNCFDQMQHEGLSANTVTFVCILKACGSLGTTERGQQFHHDIVSHGLLGKEILLGNALVDMYSKCGALAESQQVLDELPVRDVVSWNGLISGYAQKFQGKEVLSCFERMQQEGVSPDCITFTCLLNACSRSGLVDEGESFIANMGKQFGLAPDKEHKTCMVDLFCRSGYIEKALILVKKLPFCDDLAVWSILLSACYKWGNVKLGKWAFEHAVKEYQNEAAAYVFMANIYSAAGMDMEAHRIESMRLTHAAYSESCGNVSSCNVGYTKSVYKDAYEQLQGGVNEMSQAGYSPSLHLVSSVL